jgi:2-oxopent-4-enoate/cis-2-oxohex-4-enoate hydratase
MNIEAIAESLYQARLQAAPVDPLTARYPALSIADAYAISETNLKRRTGQGGARLVGKKIGLTSRAVQKQLGVEEPDFGYLTSDMGLPRGGSLSRSKLILPKVEGEVAFVLKRDLAGPGVTMEQVAAATDCVMPAIEIIDSRVRDWQIRIQDTVADNASSSHFVLGEKRPLAGGELPSARMSLKINGRELSTGTGAACLDHPCHAVAWLANALGKYGVSLKAGEVILSGAFGPVLPVQAGDRVDMEIAGLGAVHCLFGE